MKKFQVIQRASIFGMVGNLFLLIIKSVVGILTNSQAMIADAFNSAGDIISSIMTFIGNKIASVPRDKDHHLGHGKAEYIYSMLISIVMMYMCFQVFSSSISSLLKHSSYHFSFWLIVVCIVTICIKFLLYLYTNRLYKKYHNLLIRANSLDHRNDCILTFCNLLAACASFFQIYFVDGIVGIIISLWILWSSIKIFKESYDVLMDKAMNGETKKSVLDIVHEYDEIVRVNHFNATPVGYQYQISFTIYVDGNLSTFDSHSIANCLEKEISKRIPEVYLTVIHVNPIEIKKPEV